MSPPAGFPCRTLNIQIVQPRLPLTNLDPQSVTLRERGEERTQGQSSLFRQGGRLDPLAREAHP